MSSLPPVGLGPSPSMSRSSSIRLPLMLNRMFKPRQMDFEMALWQLTYLCLAPKRVYRNVYFHKQTKNTWARDDPAILILISACLAVTAVAWSIVYSYGVQRCLTLALLMIFRDFLGVGVVVATYLWIITNRFLLSPPSPTSPLGQKVEWAYAFDVHINSFFPLWLTLYVIQLPLVNIIYRDNWICLLVGNTLYLAAVAQYTYGIYLGLNALPFLIRTELLLSPLLPLFVGYIVSLLGFNVGKAALSLYFEY